MSQRIQALTARKAKLINEADADVLRIQTRLRERLADLDLKISDLTRGSEVIRSAKLAAIEAEADAIAQEDRLAHAQDVLGQRKAMAARGEDIYVPRDATEMLAILDTMEGENP